MSQKTIEEAVELWRKYNKSGQFENELNDLLENGDEDVKKRIFLSRLSFGTAGIRGKMGPGFSQMNDVVIIQTGQGLLSYLIKYDPGLCRKGIVIGYDGRYYSQRFAELTATIFINAGVPVYLFSDVCPTPFISFCIIHFKITAGVMITASHNAKEYNGYKVYLNNGAQIISPHDEGIENSILMNLEPLSSSWDTSVLESALFLIDPLFEISEAYYEAVTNSMYDELLPKNCPVLLTYTPLHGVGCEYMTELVKRMKLQPLIVVEEQEDPDPEFPTVKYPNPEEGIEVISLAIQAAEKHNSPIIIATDPDADRLGVAEKDHNAGEWRLFSGNEIGALLGWWMIETFKARHRGITDFSEIYVMTTVVSSKILKAIALAEGFNYEETLTGFKWIGNKAHELRSEGKQVIFAFEEAIGYMCQEEICDKDGISAAAKIAELASYLTTKGLNLSSKLKEIYNTYGYHVTLNSYVICEDKEVVKKVFHRLRNYNAVEQTYPASIHNGALVVEDVHDVAKGYDSSAKDKKSKYPKSKDSEMITFTFKGGIVFTLRTSGTEPKIKYYAELCCSAGISDEDKARVTLTEMVDILVTELLQPEENALKWKK